MVFELRYQGFGRGGDKWAGLPRTLYVHIYRTVLISPRTTNVLHPLAIRCKHEKELKYEGLAELALGKINYFCEHEWEGTRKAPKGHKSLLWAFFKPSSRILRRQVEEDRAAERDAAAAGKKRPPEGLG